MTHWFRQWLGNWATMYGATFRPSREVLDYAVALECGYDRVMQHHGIPPSSTVAAQQTLEQAVARVAETYNQFQRSEDYMDFLTDVRLMREQIARCPEAVSSAVRQLLKADLMPPTLRAALSELPPFDPAALVVTGLP